MMKKILLAALICLIPALAQAEPALTRVNKTNTIRCGYVEYVPGLIKGTDGGWSGYDYDIVQAVGNRLQLKVEHVAKTDWGIVVADLESNKFDMMCSGYWVHPNVGKFALFSKPIFYQPVFVIARADDKRFNDKTNLNDPALKMVALDGDNPVYIAKSDFPNAQTLILPLMTDFSQNMVSVADKKADFTIADAYTFGEYNKHNPGKLKIAAPNNPIRIYPASFVFKAEDIVFRDAVNAALDELTLDGTIPRIMSKYASYPNVFYPATTPYNRPSK